MYTYIHPYNHTWLLTHTYICTSYVLELYIFAAFTLWRSSCYNHCYCCCFLIFVFFVFAFASPVLMALNAVTSTGTGPLLFLCMLFGWSYYKKQQQKHNPKITKKKKKNKNTTNECSKGRVKLVIIFSTMILWSANRRDSNKLHSICTHILAYMHRHTNMQFYVSKYIATQIVKCIAILVISMKIYKRVHKWPHTDRHV